MKIGNVAALVLVGFSLVFGFSAGRLGERFNKEADKQISVTLTTVPVDDNKLAINEVVEADQDVKPMADATCSESCPRPGCPRCKTGKPGTAGTQGSCCQVCESTPGCTYLDPGCEGIGTSCIYR